MQLGANDYVVKIKGQTVAHGRNLSRAVPGDGQRRHHRPDPGGTETTEPAFGLPAYWITESAALAGRAAQLHRRRSDRRSGDAPDGSDQDPRHELLTRQEVKNLLDNLKARVPALIEEVIPTQIKPGELQKVMQNLLRERVPVRDLETIIETLGDYAAAPRIWKCSPNTCAMRWRAPSASNMWTIRIGSGASRSIPASGGFDQRSYRAQRARHDKHNAAANGAADRADRSRQSAELTQTGRPAVILCGPPVRAGVAANDRGTHAACGGAGVQRNCSGGDGGSGCVGGNEW